MNTSNHNEIYIYAIHQEQGDIKEVLAAEWEELAAYEGNYPTLCKGLENVDITPGCSYPAHIIEEMIAAPYAKVRTAFYQVDGWKLGDIVQLIDQSSSAGMLADQFSGLLRY